jgi:Ca2+-binding EF-hand superfamily protein
MRSCSLVLASLVLLTGPVMAQTAPPTSGEVNRAFEETDRNRDGGIDREEFHRRTVEVFYFLDVNRDGVLETTEVVNIRTESFRGADRDNDGKLSLQEYLNARFKDFEAMDANGDGAVTVDELERFTREQGPAR